VARKSVPADPEQALLGLLGLAARARAVVSGTEQVRAEARKGRLELVVLARDAAAGQRSKLTGLLDAREISYFSVLSREQLGSAIGRAPVSAIGLKQQGFARRAAELAALIAGRQDHVQEEV
jgi:ribosomal protein L7Ae-like RNA K-turn-binding protein